MRGAAVRSDGIRFVDDLRHEGCNHQQRGGCHEWDGNLCECGRRAGYRYGDCAYGITRLHAKDSYGHDDLQVASAEGLVAASNGQVLLSKVVRWLRNGAMGADFQGHAEEGFYVRPFKMGDDQA
jgi:hypothetical protein